MKSAESAGVEKVENSKAVVGVGDFLQKVKGSEVTRASERKIKNAAIKRLKNPVQVDAS